jgi:hypothetical protein
MPANAGQTWKRRFDRQTILPYSASYQTEASPYNGPIYVVQSATSFLTTDALTSGYSTNNIVLPKNTTPGNCLVLCYVQYHASTNPSVTIGGTGDNWELAIGSGGDLYVYTDQNCVGGQNTVTVGCAPSGILYKPYFATVYEIAGIASSNAVDVAINNGTSAVAWTSGISPVTVQSSEIAIGVVFLGNSIITAPSTPWVNTATPEWFPAETWYAQSGYRILTGKSTVNYSGTMNYTGVGNNTSLITLKATNPSANVVYQQPANPGEPWRRQFRHSAVTPSYPNAKTTYKISQDDFFLMFG